MFKFFIIIIFSLALLKGNIPAQELFNTVIKLNNNEVNDVETKNTSLKVKEDFLTDVKPEYSLFDKSQMNYMKEFLHFNFQKSRAKTGFQVSTVIESFQSNVRFGGYWNQHISILITPSMYIEPTDNISFYAQRVKNLFFPLADLKEHIKEIAVESAGLVLTEIFFKLAMTDNKVLKSISNFLLKNLLSYAIISLNTNHTNKSYNSILINDYYYLRTGIRFELNSLF